MILRMRIDYMPPNWNEYIRLERGTKYGANQLKQQEKDIVMYNVKCKFRGKQYTGNYPVEIVFRPHYSAYRQDLDNFRYKGLLDGLVTAGVLKNDNLRHIQKITIEPIFSKAECVEIEIKEI